MGGRGSERRIGGLIGNVRLAFSFEGRGFPAAPYCIEMIYGTAEAVPLQGSRPMWNLVRHFSDGTFKSRGRTSLALANHPKLGTPGYLRNLNLLAYYTTITLRHSAPC